MKNDELLLVKILREYLGSHAALRAAAYRVDEPDERWQKLMKEAQDHTDEARRLSDLLPSFNKEIGRRMEADDVQPRPVCNAISPEDWDAHAAHYQRYEGQVEAEFDQLVKQLELLVETAGIAKAKEVLDENLAAG